MKNYNLPSTNYYVLQDLLNNILTLYFVNDTSEYTMPHSHQMQPSPTVVSSKMPCLQKVRCSGKRRRQSSDLESLSLPHILPVSKHQIWTRISLSGMNNYKRPHEASPKKNGKQENMSVVKQEHKATRRERAKMRRHEVCGLAPLYLSASALPCAFNSVTHKEASNVWLFDSMVYRNAFP